MEHIFVKVLFIAFYACVTAYAAYKFLMGYVAKHHITEERNPMFADLLRGLIAVGISVDIAFGAWLVSEVVR